MAEYIQTSNPKFLLRFSEQEDCKLILHFIKELARYENLLDQVVATEEILKEWLFERKVGEVLIGEYEGKPIGFMLFFYNFSTFLGKAGLYLEDLYVEPEMRGKGLGKIMLSQLAKLAVQRRCGRVEWACLDWNEPSVQFYKSLGAVPMDEWTVYRLTGENLDQLAAKSDFQ